ncbi:hypothetical protein D3C72_2175380 [compost metagenome]
MVLQPEEVADDRREDGNVAAEAEGDGSHTGEEEAEVQFRIAESQRCSGRYGECAADQLEAAHLIG